MDLRRVLALGLAVSIACAVAPSYAQAAVGPVPPAQLPAKPASFAIDAGRAVAIASAAPEVGEQAERHGRLTTAIEVREPDGWQVGFRAGEEEVVQVIVDAGTGAVREAWTGDQVAWPMARGYQGQFGHVLNAPWVWIPLCLAFLGGLLDWRRPWRIVHLDLLALLAFGVSHVFFNRGEIGISVPLVYPVLAYLLVRMLWLGFRGGEPLRPSAPAVWLALAAVFLLAMRVTLNVVDSGVIDVGYAGTVGADRVAHGEPLYGEGRFPDDNPFGDTYGPVNYLAYVPFELALPWSGEWDQLAASHAAAIAFDLATVAGLAAFALRLRAGRRGRELAAVLAFAWLAYPYTAFALQSNANDSLIAALLVWALALFARPLARGALLALAVAAKFAPLPLVPLFATGDRGLAERWRGRQSSPPRGLLPVATFSAAFCACLALVLAHPAIDPGLATFWERTVASQVERSSPFSIWGQLDGIGWLKDVVMVATAALAVGLALVPRRRTIAQVAALAAAVLIAVELSAEHWFYLYIPWFAPALLIALATTAVVREPTTGYRGCEIPDA